VQTNAVYYVYDGNVVIQERNINNLPTTTYTRGLDLSSTVEGRGGNRRPAGHDVEHRAWAFEFQFLLITIATATET
jgi:hypothetical protein